MQYPLKLEKASYQTWDAGAKHRGTQVEVILVGETEHVKITGLIFRSKSSIPMIKNIDGKLVLTADFESGTEKVSGELIVDSKIDMIIYTHKGKVYELPLKDIQRKSMKYYPKQ
jgi:hypothetical protein